MRKGHEWVEMPFGPTRHFGRVIEVGAGSGQHVGFVRHGFDEYLLTDRSSALLDRAGAALPEDRRARLRLAREDATRPSLADRSEEHTSDIQSLMRSS